MEVLVALVLTALAAGGLAAVALTSARALTMARRDATATALAVTRLEALRAGPRGDGTDVATVAGETYARQWSVVRGRGRPDATGVTLGWGAHDFALASEAWP